MQRNNWTNKEVLDNHKINLTKKNNDWNLYIPCGYKNAQTELKNFNEVGKHIYSLEDCDKLSGKVNLWKIIINHYGRNEAKK